MRRAKLQFTSAGRTDDKTSIQSKAIVGVRPSFSAQPSGFLWIDFG